jgi:hypothetical protein
MCNRGPNRKPDHVQKMTGDRPLHVTRLPNDFVISEDMKSPLIVLFKAMLSFRPEFLLPLA